MRCSSPSQGLYLTYRRPYERDHRARLVGGLLDIVSDTGVGLPEGLDVHATESLGWQLVRILTEQLRGTIALEGHGGTTVTITFPI
jgi:two-component sensor histidine kinase